MSPMGGIMGQIVERLYACAKRVAKTHNGKRYPRHAQIDAIVQLQLVIEQIESLAQAKKDQELVLLELPLLEPLPSE